LPDCHSIDLLGTNWRGDIASVIADVRFVPGLLDHIDSSSIIVHRAVMNAGFASRRQGANKSEKLK
jgi:hypothetical protein